jgi:hypothetical protein
MERDTQKWPPLEWAYGDRTVEAGGDFNLGLAGVSGERRVKFVFYLPVFTRCGQ